MNIPNIASLHWTQKANKVNELNSDELKPTKQNPAPMKGIQSHNTSLFSNFEPCDLSIGFELVMLFLRVELWTSVLWYSSLVWPV